MKLMDTEANQETFRIKLPDNLQRVCLAYNLRRLHRIAGSKAKGTNRPKSPSMVGGLIQNLTLDQWLGRNINAIFRQGLRQTTESITNLALTPTGS